MLADSITIPPNRIHPKVLELAHEFLDEFLYLSLVVVSSVVFKTFFSVVFFLFFQKGVHMQTCMQEIKILSGTLVAHTTQRGSLLSRSSITVFISAFSLRLSFASLASCNCNFKASFSARNSSIS